MNGLDKFARRSKRVGGAIADFWGCVIMYPPIFPELSSQVEKLSYPGKSSSRAICHGERGGFKCLDMFFEVCVCRVGTVFK